MHKSVQETIYMILAILPIVCCSTFVVKILQERSGGDAVALAASGNKLVATRDLGDERAEFIISKVGEAAGPAIEISPIAAPRKKLVVGADNAVRISSGGGGQRPWTVKKEGDMHKLVVGSMCLSLRGRTARMESCQKNKPDQAFMITSDDEDAGECSNSSDCEQDTHGRKHVVHRHYEPAPSEEVEYVHVVGDRPETVTDVVVKTSYKTVTLHTTSTVTSTVGPFEADARPPRAGRRRTGRSKSLSFPKSVIVHVHEDPDDGVSLETEPEKPLSEGADFVQNVVRAKKGHEAASESSTENGLEDLIKVFNGSDKHSGFIDIRAPKMFTGKCDRMPTKK